jgi:hypothetical protein
MSTRFHQIFTKYPKEAAIIGRLLAGYGELEISLMNCVQVARDDLDAGGTALLCANGSAAWNLFSLRSW